MSDAKKTGSRDISELKQRLGLKKGAAAATGQNARQNGASGGVVAPPGLSLPPPPGVPQSAPQPVIPNAADDPFGAMNAMAAVGTVQRAPEIVIVNDGRPVEGVHSGKGQLLKILVPAVLGIGVGVAIGSIGKSASFYNDGISGAKAVMGAPECVTSSCVQSYLGVRKTLSDLDTVLDAAKGKGYRPDTDITNKLQAIQKRLDTAVNSDVVYKIRASGIDPDTVASVSQFYGGAAEVKGMIETHVKMAKMDDMLLAAGKKKADDTTDQATGRVNFGVVIEGAEGGAVGAKLVELGPPYCGGKLTTGVTKCPDNDQTAIAVRDAAGGTWNPGDQAQTTDSLAAKKLLLLVPDNVSDALIKGSDSGAAEAYYVKRMRAIVDRVAKLRQDADKIESSLNTAATAKTRFSFGM